MNSNSASLIDFRKRVKQINEVYDTTSFFVDFGEQVNSFLEQIDVESSDEEEQIPEKSLSRIDFIRGDGTGKFGERDKVPQFSNQIQISDEVESSFMSSRLDSNDVDYFEKQFAEQRAIPRHSVKYEKLGNEHQMEKIRKSLMQYNNLAPKYKGNKKLFRRRVCFAITFFLLSMLVLAFWVLMILNTHGVIFEDPILLYQAKIFDKYQMFENIQFDVKQNFLQTEKTYQLIFLYWIAINQLFAINPLLLWLSLGIINILIILLYPLFILFFVVFSGLMLPISILIGKILQFVYIIPIKICQQIYNHTYENKLKSKGRTQRVLIFLLWNANTEFRAGFALLWQLVVTLVIMLPFQLLFIAMTPITFLYLAIYKLMAKFCEINIQYDDIGEYNTKVLQYIAPRLDQKINFWRESCEFQAKLMTMSINVSQNDSNTKRYFFGLIEFFQSWKKNLPRNFHQVFRSIIVAVVPSILVILYQLYIFYTQTKKIYNIKVEECEKLYDYSQEQLTSCQQVYKTESWQIFGSTLIDFILFDLLPYLLMIGYNYLMTQLTFYELNKYPQYLKDQYYLSLNYSNLSLNKPEDIANAFLSEPLRILIGFIGFAPVTLRLGLFFNNKLYFASKRITRIALVFLIAFLMIIGTQKVIQMQEVTGSENFEDQIQYVVFNLNSYENFPLSIEVSSQEFSSSITGQDVSLPFSKCSAISSGVSCSLNQDETKVVNVTTEQPQLQFNFQAKTSDKFDLKLIFENKIVNRYRDFIQNQTIILKDLQSGQMLPSGSLSFQVNNISYTQPNHRHDMFLNLKTDQILTTASSSDSFTLPIKVVDIQIIHLFTKVMWLDTLSYIGGLLSTVVSFFAGVLGIINYYIFFDKILRNERIAEYQKQELDSIDQEILHMYKDTEDKIIFFSKEKFEKHCQLLQKYFYKYNCIILQENTSNPIYVVKDVLAYRDSDKDKNQKLSVFNIITGSLSREFKAKINLFTEANSYDNLYVLNQTVKKLEGRLQLQRQNIDEYYNFIQMQQEQIEKLEKEKTQMADRLESTEERVAKLEEMILKLL